MERGKEHRDGTNRSFFLDASIRFRKSPVDEPVTVGFDIGRSMRETKGSTGTEPVAKTKQYYLYFAIGNDFLPA